MRLAAFFSTCLTMNLKLLLMFNKEIKINVSKKFFRDPQDNVMLWIISGFIRSFSSCTKKGSIVCINMASYLFLIGDLLPEWISVYCNPSFLKQIKCFWNLCVKIVVFV